MHEYEVPRPSGAGSADESGASWTILDMLKAIGIMILVLIGVSIVAGVAAYAIAGDVDEIENDATALTVALAASIPFEIALGVVAYQFSVGKYRISLSDFGFRRPDNGWDRGPAIGVVLWTLFSLGLCGISLLSMVIYFAIISGLGADPDVDLPEEVFDSPGPIIVAAVLSIGFAPVMEETFFRGFIFGGLVRPWGVVLAALGSGLLFGMAHVGNPGAYYVVPPIAIIGVIFAWGYAFSGSLYPGMAAHFVFNLISLIGQLTSQ